MKISRSTNDSYTGQSLTGIDIELLQEFWKDEMLTEGPDQFRISVFSENNTEIQIQNGYLPDRPEPTVEMKREMAAKLLVLSEAMRNHYPEAAQKITRPFHFLNIASEQQGIAILYSKCKDGIISIGWHNDGDMHKARTMTTFVLYILGLANASSDEVLYEVATVRLPYRDRRINYKDARILFGRYYLNVPIP